MRLRLVTAALVLVLGTLPPLPAAAQQVGQRCFTPTFWCVLPAPAIIGSNCFCATPYGPVYGRVG